MYFQYSEMEKHKKTVEIFKNMSKYTLLDIKVENCSERMAIVHKDKYDPKTNTCRWQAKHIESALDNSAIAIYAVDGTFHYFGGLKSVPKMVKDTLTIKTDDGMIYTIMGLKADN